MLSLRNFTQLKTKSRTSWAPSSHSVVIKQKLPIFHSRTIKYLPPEDQRYHLPLLEFEPNLVKFTCNGLVNRELVKEQPQIEEQIINELEKNPKDLLAYRWALANFSRLKDYKYKISEKLFVRLFQGLVQNEMFPQSRSLYTEKIRKFYYRQLVLVREEPTEPVLNSLAEAYGANWDLENIQKTREEIDRYKFKASVGNYEGLITTLKERGEMDEAVVQFKKMRAEGITPSLKIQNILLDGWARQKNYTKLTTTFTKIIYTSGVQPDVTALNYILAYSSEIGDWDACLKHYDTVKTNYAPNATTIGHMLTLTVNTNKPELADFFLQDAEFFKIPRVPEFLGPLVGVHAAKGDMEAAVKTYHEMDSEHVPIEACYYLAKGFLAKGDEKNASKWKGSLRSKFETSKPEQVGIFLDKLEPKQPEQKKEVNEKK